MDGYNLGIQYRTSAKTKNQNITQEINKSERKIRDISLGALSVAKSSFSRQKRYIEYYPL